MKQYVIDELRPEDYEKLKTALTESLGPPELGNLYPLPLAPALWNQEQRDHLACQPFYLTLDLQRGQLCCELLIRTRNAIRCRCMGYANPDQVVWLIRWVDALFETHQIIT
jgi:hypothetical protein